MARRATLGFELGSATAGVELTAVQNIAMSLAAALSGAFGADINLSTQQGFNTYQFNSGDTQGDHRASADVVFSSFPAATRDIFGFQSTTGLKMVIRLTSAGRLQLYNVEDSAQIGSDSAILSTGVKYRIELRQDTTTLASTVADARIDGVSFASGTVNLAAGARDIFFGCNGGTATFRAFWDNIRVNDGTGSFQNSWPGAGEVVHLNVNADGDNSAFSSSSGGADYTNVDETPPNDATDYVQSTAADTEDFNIDDPIWLASDATVNVVHVGGRFRVSSNTGTQPIIVWRVKASSGGTVEESGNITLTTTAWNTHTTATPKNPTLVLYDLPGASTTAWTRADLKTAQVGVRNTNDPTNFTQVSKMWLSVDYVQGTGMYVESVTTATASAAASVGATVMTRGSNRVLAVAVAAFDATSGDRQVSSITHNGDALAQVNETELAGGEHNEIWSLVNPDLGANTVTVTMGGTCSNVQLVAVVFANANQSGQPEANQAENDAATTTGSVSVTTVADKAWILSIAQTSNFAMTGIGANQTQIASLQSNFILASLYRDITPAGATASTYTTGSNDSFALAAASFIPLATSQVKKLVGATQATVKKVSGNAIASVKKIAGVANV